MNADLFTDEPAPTSSNDSLFSEEPAPERSFTGFAKNLGTDAMETGKALAGTAKTLVDPFNLTESAMAGSLEPTKEHLSQQFEGLKEVPGGLMNEAKRIGVGELATGHPINAAEKFAGAAYDKPVTTAMDVAPLVMGEGAIPKEPSGIGKFLKNTGESIEANATAGALDLNPLGIRKLAKRGQNPETVILDLNKKVKELMPDAIELTDTPSSKYQKFLDANQSASQAIGRVIDTTTQKMGSTLPEADAAIAELRAEANSPRFKGATSQRNIDARAELLDAATHLEELKKTGDLNFQSLYEVKKGIGEAYHNPTIENPGVDKAYATISKKIDDIVDRASIDDPDLKGDFDHAKKVFKLTSDLLPVMHRGVARDVAGTGGGLSNAAIGAGAIFGHPLTAGAAYVGKTAAKLAAPDLMRNIAYKTVNAVKDAPSLPSLNMNAALAAYLANEFKKKKEGE